MSDKSSIERERYTQSLIEKWRNDYDAKEGEQIEKANAAKIEPSSGLNVSSPKQMRPKEQADSKDIESTDLDVDIDEDLNFVISKLSTPAGTLRGSTCINLVHRLCFASFATNHTSYNHNVHELSKRNNTKSIN